MKITGSVRLYGVFIFCVVIMSNCLSDVEKCSWNFEQLLPFTIVGHLVQELMIIWNDLQVLHEMYEHEHQEVIFAAKSIAYHLNDVNDCVCSHGDRLCVGCGAFVEKIEYVIALVHKIKLVYVQKKNELFLSHESYFLIEDYLVALENNLFSVLDAYS